MTKNKAILASILTILACASFVYAFDLVELIPLHSHDRQEARIDGYWLIVEETNSTLTGYIVPQRDTGSIDLFYEGHDYLGKYHSREARLLITNVWDGTYGTHFSGEGFSGFYRESSGQIYVSWGAGDWVTFINHLEIPIRVEK